MKENILGIAFALKQFLDPLTISLKSDFTKCSEHTFIDEDTFLLRFSSRRIFIIHNFLSAVSLGNEWNDIPGLKALLLQPGTQQY